MRSPSGRGEAKVAIFIITWILGFVVIGTLHYVSELSWLITISIIVVWGIFVWWLYHKT